METATVTEILDANAKSGQRKDGKGTWSMSRVGLSNGESTFIFNPVELGNEVEAYEKDGFKNWRVKKPDPKHDEIMKALRAIYKAITTGEVEGTAVKEKPEPAKPTPKPAEKAVDTVYDVEGEPVSLEDIPF